MFKVTKNNHVFWVGAAVPFGTNNFSKIQVFFHPTVVQGQTVHATEGDYPHFRGGWSGSLQRYIALEGGQLAAVRQVPMLVPFTTMAALGGGPNNMFAQDPVATLSYITAAVQSTVYRFRFRFRHRPSLTWVLQVSVPALARCACS